MAKKKYTVKYRDRQVVINEKLVKQQKINAETLEQIKAVHESRLMLFDIMENTPINTVRDNDFLVKCDRTVDHLESILQFLWGFPQDKRYIRFWERPRCSCPKLDNEDRYPTGYYIISEDCILHNFGSKLR